MEADIFRNVERVHIRAQPDRGRFLGQLPNGYNFAADVKGRAARQKDVDGLDDAAASEGGLGLAGGQQSLVDVSCSTSPK